MLRGALGYGLKATATGAIYETLFAPKLNDGPSGLASPPRPFVLRATNLEGDLPAGSELSIEINLFDIDRSFEFHQAISRAIDSLQQQFTVTASQLRDPFEIDLSAPADPPEKITLDFFTPVELKGAPADGSLPFGLFFRRVRDRISSLMSIYQGGAPAVDFRTIGERSDRIITVSNALRPVKLQRKSTRTGETHPIGGSIGSVTVAGDLGEFMPWLEAARHAGVGRHAVWGNGQYRIQP